MSLALIAPRRRGRRIGRWWCEVYGGWRLFADKAIRTAIKQFRYSNAWALFSISCTQADFWLLAAFSVQRALLARASSYRQPTTIAIVEISSALVVTRKIMGRIKTHTRESAAIRKWCGRRNITPPSWGACHDKLLSAFYSEVIWFRARESPSPSS